MQLKITRSQRETGLMSKTVAFVIDARVQFTPKEAEEVNRYKLGPTLIYSSANAQQHAAAVGVQRPRTDTTGWDSGSKVMQAATDRAFAGIMSLGHAALSRLSLSITINSLSQGQHIECKDLEEVMGAENALIQACENLQAYLLTAAQFNGQTQVISFNEEAKAQPVQPITPPTAPALAPAQGAGELLLSPEKKHDLKPLF